MNFVVGKLGTSRESTVECSRVGTKKIGALGKWAHRVYSCYFFVVGKLGTSRESTVESSRVGRFFLWALGKWAILFFVYVPICFYVGNCITMLYSYMFTYVFVIFMWAII